MRVIGNKKFLAVVFAFVSSMSLAQTIVIPAPPLPPPGLPGVIATIAGAAPGTTIIFAGSSYGPFLAPIVVPAARISFVSEVNSTTLFSAGPAGPVLLVPPGANFSCEGIDFQYSNAGLSRNTHVAVVGAPGLLPTNISIDDCGFSGGIRNLLGAPPAGDGLVLLGNVTGTIVNSRFTNNQGNGITVGPNGLAPANPTRPNIMRNVISNNGLAGVSIVAPATPLLEDNKIDSNRGSGVSYAGAGGGLATNNIVDTNGGNGFDITNAATPTIDNNTVFNNGRDGFNIRNLANPNVTNNDVRGNMRVAFALGIAASGTFNSNLCQGNLGTPIGGPAQTLGDGFFRQFSQTATIGNDNVGCPLR